MSQLLRVDTNPQTSPLAACRGSELDFTSYNKTEVDKCLAVCRRCPIRRACLSNALAQGGTLDYGIFGACTEVMRYLIRQGKYTAETSLIDKKTGNPRFRYWVSVSGYHKSPAPEFNKTCIKCGDEFSVMDQHKGTGAYPSTCIRCRVRKKAHTEIFKVLKSRTYRCLLCNNEYTITKGASKIRPWCKDRCCSAYADMGKSSNPDLRERHAYLAVRVKNFEEAIEQEIELYITNRADAELAVSIAS